MKGRMRLTGLLATLLIFPLLSSCGDNDEEQREKAARFTTSTKPAPNPQRESLESLVRTDRNAAPTSLVKAPKFKLFSDYKGEDIRQVTGVSGRTLILCFAAPWCPYSNRMRNGLQQIANQGKGTVQVVMVNPDEYTSLAKDFELNKVPTTVFYTEGVKLRTIEGAYTAESVRSFLHALLSQDERARGTASPVLVPITISNK